MLKFYFKNLITDKEVKLKYKHLTQEERYHIAALKKAKFSQKYIANEIGVNKGTISRELKRNSSGQIKSYSAKNAHKVSTTRRRYASKKSNFKMDLKTKNIIKKFIIKNGLLSKYRIG